MTASKETLRYEAILHRDRIDAFDRDEDPDVACDNFFEAVKPDKDKIVALYWPKGREFDPGSILLKLLRNGNKCLLPVVTEGERLMKFARWHEDDPLEEGPYKIMQPVLNDDTEWLDPDIVIVPMLAFDRRGYRLGYGGGYYDATLADLRSRKDVLAVGVAYAQQAVIFNLPVEGHDEKLDWVITPQKAHSFAD